MQCVGKTISWFSNSDRINNPARSVFITLACFAFVCASCILSQNQQLITNTDKSKRVFSKIWLPKQQRKRRQQQQLKNQLLPKKDQSHQRRDGLQEEKTWQQRHQRPKRKSWFQRRVKSKPVIRANPSDFFVFLITGETVS